MKPIQYQEITGHSPAYYGLLAGFAVLLGAGLLAAHYMESHGHHVTGMTNQVVWGTPHIFAVFLIVAASGVLNMASVGSVFGVTVYKPLGRLSGLMALALLAGGLAVLVLDLGRPDRLIVAMTTYNFKSIFAWNIFLYTGFFVIVAVYLWFMMERRMNPHSKKAGLFAFVWRLILTTGTGSIFGWLVARQAYDTALMAPLFIAMSLAFGTAIFLLTLMAAYKGTGWQLGDVVVYRLKNLLGVFVAAVLYFVAVYHFTNLYSAAHHDVERFILMEGGRYTAAFWLGQVLLGGLMPLILLYHPMLGKSRFWIGAAALLVIAGGFAQMYVIIIGGQAYPLVLFPGMEVSSPFFDGQVSGYAPSLPEVALGLGGVALAGLTTVLGVKLLRFMPSTLADVAIDPHHRVASETDTVALSNA